ncbi:MAG TPA: hypothetical protein PKD63_10615 [Solirubrobacteraceae bacterium]|nr:hypothetical protein [Solirubrobacteraceae bacterium]
MTLLDVPTRDHAVPPAPPAADEAAARRALREQIALLEHRLSCAVVDSMPDGGVVTGVPELRGPRVLTLGELERLRDALAGRVADARALLEERERRREDARLLLERMLLEPGRHRHVRIPRRELGEGGCGVWHVRPRLGVVGRLMGWWQVKLSSGCPLAT